MTSVHRSIRNLFLALCPILLLSCHTSDDATAAAKQLATTSNDLASYYGTLSQIVTADIALNDLQKALQGVPFDDQLRDTLMMTSSELQQRAAMAKALQDLSAAFSNLSGSTAPSDVSDAATKLGTELTTLKAIPSTGTIIPIPELMGKVGNLVLTLVRNHEEKKIAPALDQTVSAMKDLFSKEQDVYDSLNKTYLNLAALLAKKSIDAHFVDQTSLETSIVNPALQPFGLTAHIAPTTDTAKLDALVISEIDQTNKDLVGAHQKASKAMLDSITQMGTRIHQLATEGQMPTRGTPISLSTVEGWVTTVSNYFPNSSQSSSNTGSTGSTGTTANSKSTTKKPIWRN
jgi:hypothetical protein